MAANVNNYISAANAAVSKNVQIRKALADSKVRYDRLGNAAVNQDAANRINVAQNNASTANTTIRAQANVAGEQMRADTKEKIRGIEKKSRMTGMLAGGVALLGVGAGMLRKKEEPNAELELLKSQKGFYDAQIQKSQAEIARLEAEGLKADKPDDEDSGGTTTKKTNASDGTSSAQDAIASTATDTYPGGKVDFSSIRDMAKTSGAKFPELVAAQWALESDWGRKPSGKNNYFGIKAGEGESGTSKGTWEVINGKKVNTSANFKNFDTPSGSVNELVNRWYKDYGKYKGVNRANSASEAAGLLTVEGYATDPEYANKLRSILERQGY